MQRLIDISPVFAAMEQNGTDKCSRQLLEMLPVVDAVSVVRCGQCKYFHNRTCKIRKGSWGETLKVGYTDYCSDGERKDGDTNE